MRVDDHSDRPPKTLGPSEFGLWIGIRDSSCTDAFALCRDLLQILKLRPTVDDD
jgi:hypothetical protein